MAKTVISRLLEDLQRRLCSWTWRGLAHKVGERLTTINYFHGLFHGWRGGGGTPHPSKSLFYQKNKTPPNSYKWWGWREPPVFQLFGRGWGQAVKGGGDGAWCVCEILMQILVPLGIYMHNLVDQNKCCQAQPSPRKTKLRVCLAVFLVSPATPTHPPTNSDLIQILYQWKMVGNSPRK